MNTYSETLRAIEYLLDKYTCDERMPHFRPSDRESRRHLVRYDRRKASTGKRNPVAASHARTRNMVTEEEAKKIAHLFLVKRLSGAVIAARFNRSVSLVSIIVTGKHKYSPK